jgi:hypothetical protein
MPGGTLLIFIGNSRCRIDFVTLTFGTNKFPGLGLASCEGVTPDKVDVDGMLPTNIFDRFCCGVPTSTGLSMVSEDRGCPRFERGDTVLRCFGG